MFKKILFPCLIILISTLPFTSCQKNIGVQKDKHVAKEGNDFDNYIASITKSQYSDYAQLPETKASAAAFEEMKAAILQRYILVEKGDITKSFALQGGGGRICDCIPFYKQPGMALAPWKKDTIRMIFTDEITQALPEGDNMFGMYAKTKMGTTYLGGEPVSCPHEYALFGRLDLKEMIKYPSLKAYSQKFDSLEHAHSAIKIPELKFERPDSLIQEYGNRSMSALAAVAIFTDISPEKDGVWMKLDNGDKLWHLKISSVESRALFLSLVDFSLEQGAELYVYDDSGEQLEVYTSKHNRSCMTFNTSEIKGEILHVAYYEPKACKENRKFRIDRVCYM